MPFIPRPWQNECFEKFQKKIRDGGTNFIFEACMGAGKSPMAAMMAKSLVTDHNIHHVIALVPWRSIQEGMLTAFGNFDLDPRERFFIAGRRLVRQPRPRMPSTITLYQEICCPQAIETIRMWMADAWQFALICDEIHHTNEINSSWGEYVEQLQSLAKYSVFMSGTYFRGDKMPISCIPLDEKGIPVKDYRFPYEEGVREGVVRAVTESEIDAKVVLYDRRKDKKYEIDLSAVTDKEFSEAKKQVLDPTGECIRHMIELVHRDLMLVRDRFPDAACLFVCRPGGGDNYTAEGSERQEDRHVQVIAQQIERITGLRPTIVTHHDRDSQAKITRFRRGTDPYLVAVNMVSEGCDIPRLRAVAFCRYTDSEMLFRQIVGRALRLHAPEDGTPALIYIPVFPQLLEFAKRIYDEAQEGIRNRTCPVCGEWPCICPCPVCGKNPCECEKIRCFPPEPSIIGIDAIPVPDGGHVGAEHVAEFYVAFFRKMAERSVTHRHCNPVQQGHLLQEFHREMLHPVASPATPPADPTAERERVCAKINRFIRRLGIGPYHHDFAKAYHEEIEIPFHASFKVIRNTWEIEKLRQIAEHLEQRVMEAFRA